MLTQKLDWSTHAARVAQIADELITEHGQNAVHVAIARLNDAIDRGRPDFTRFLRRDRVCDHRTGPRRFNESQSPLAAAKFLIGAEGLRLRGKLTV